MIKLDKSKIYYLEDLNYKQYKELYNYLKTNYSWRNVKFKQWKNENRGYNLVFDNTIWSMQQKQYDTNALELFYTLENVQVDCRNLSDEQIDNILSVFELNSFDTRRTIKATKDDYYIGLGHVFSSFLPLWESKYQITYDKFMELFGEKEGVSYDKDAKTINIHGVDLVAGNNVNLSDTCLNRIDDVVYGLKETENKLNYELDFEFIKAMTERIESETKYPPYNWQKPIDTEMLQNALFRHAIEIKQGNFNDEGKELQHLVAVACNAMFLYYQLKNNK